jgi:pimeloyl-ACP methyl ester carboxylesterase
MPYAPINGLQMYHEIHGEGRPLVLLHGALSATETSFGPLVAELARTRQVIPVEQQAHGRTADIDRPLRVEHMVDDTIALLEHLGIENADLYGYSVGSAVALNVAAQRPELVRKLVLASMSFRLDGMHPGVAEGVEHVTPEMMIGSPFEEEFRRLSPDPDGWANLVYKVVDMNKNYRDFGEDAVRSLRAPALLIIGDSDIVRPEHAVEMFRLFGGGVMGDSPAGLPDSQLAILPGTSHVSLPYQVEVLQTIIPKFLDAE